MVSRRMFLSLRDWASGRDCRCFSREERRSSFSRGLSSGASARVWLVGEWGPVFSLPLVVDMLGVVVVVVVVTGGSIS